MEKISSDRIKELLPSGLPIILDEYYLKPTTKNIIDFVKENYTKQFDYIENSHDCDNAAWEFVSLFSGLGWPVGLAIVEGHSLVLVVNDKEEVMFIEPQTGEIVKNNKRLKITVMP